MNFQKLLARAFQVRQKKNGEKEQHALPQVYRVARLVGWLASASTSAVRWRPEEDFGSVKTGSRLQKEVTEGHERMCRVTVGMSRRKGGSARAAERAEEETSLALSSRVSSSRSEQSGKEDPTAERKDNEKGQDGLGCSPLVALENVHPTYARRASWELVRPCTPLCVLSGVPSRTTVSLTKVSSCLRETSPSHLCRSWALEHGVDSCGVEVLGPSVRVQEGGTERRKRL